MENYILLCTGTAGGVIAVLALIAFFRYLSYRETLALAEKGLARPEKPHNGKGTLRWGILLSAIGLALCLGLWPLGANVGSRYPLGFGPWMLFGLLPLFFGLALVLIYVLTKES